MPGNPGDLPLVSVIIPTYKRPAQVCAAVESVRAQALRDIEIIVVDDCSGDDTVECVTALGDPRVRVLVHESNKGANAARATGIATARGEWVAFLDSDDRWLPEKLERQLSLVAERGPEYGLCTTWFTGLDPSGTQLFTVQPTLDGEVAMPLMCRNDLGGYSTALVRRVDLLAVDGVDETLPACQDWDLWVRLAQRVKVCVVQEHLVDYLVDDTDAVRITNSTKRVILGHRHMYRSLRGCGHEIPVRLRSRATRYFGGQLAHVGAVGDVLRVARDSLLAGDLRDARFCAHMVVRSVRKRLAMRAAKASGAQAQAAGEVASPSPV